MRCDERCIRSCGICLQRRCSFGSGPAGLFVCACQVAFESSGSPDVLPFCFETSATRVSLQPSMASTSFWAGACNAARSRPLQMLLDINYACCGVTVSARLPGRYDPLWMFVQSLWQRCCARCCRCLLVNTWPAASSVLSDAATQIGAFCVSAAASGTMFLRWWWVSEERKKRMWRMYGWFTGLMCCGSCIGAVAWTLSMIALADLFTTMNPASTLSPFEQERLAAQAFRLLAAFLVLYAVEFFFLTLAKLMVLSHGSCSFENL